MVVFLRLVSVVSGFGGSFRSSLASLLSAFSSRGVGSSFVFRFGGDLVDFGLLVSEGFLSAVLSFLRAHVPFFSFSRGSFPSLEGFSAFRVVGEPRVDASLSPVVEFFVSQGLEGFYFVVLEPYRFSFLRRFVLSRSLSGLSGSSSDSAGVRSFRDALREEYLRRVFDRSLRRDLHRVSVYFLLRQGDAHRFRDLFSVFVSTFEDRFPEGRFKFKRVSLERAMREIFGFKVGRGGVVLAPDEAAGFLDFPSDLPGLRLRDIADLSVPRFDSSDGVFLGNIVRRDRVTGLKLFLPVSSFRKHVGIFGLTGFGKTSTCLSLISQLWRDFKVPFVVISPVKREYRSLVRVFGDVEVFTVGREDLRPLRFNPFIVPSNVSVVSHIDGLKASFNASFVLYAPMPYVLEQSIYRVYEKRGWDLKNNIRGETPSLLDLYREVDYYTGKLGYDREVTMNVRAALKTRLKSLMVGAKGSMFLAGRNDFLDVFLKKPIYLELDHVEDEEEKSFIMGLILLYIYEKLKLLDETNDLRVVIVVEEAHRLLKNYLSQSPNLESADSFRWAIQYFTNMLSELRAYGGGIIVVEQIPSKLVSDVVKNTGTKIVHRILAKDDKNLLGATMRLDEDDLNRLTGLGVGEAIVFTEKYPFPIAVKIPNIVEKLNLRHVSDDELKELISKRYPSTTQRDGKVEHPSKRTQKLIRSVSPKKHQGHKRPLNQLDKVDETGDTARFLILPYIKKYFKMPLRKKEKELIIRRNLEKLFEDRVYVKLKVRDYERNLKNGSPESFAEGIFIPTLKGVGPLLVEDFALSILTELKKYISFDEGFLKRARAYLRIRSRDAKILFLKKIINNLLSSEEFTKNFVEFANSHKEDLYAVLKKEVTEILDDQDADDFIYLLVKALAGNEKISLPSDTLYNVLRKLVREP